MADTDLKAEAVRRYQEGISRNQIAADMHRAVPTITRWLIESGERLRTQREMTFLYRGTTPIEKPSAAALSELYLRQCMSCADIAALWGVSAATVTRYLKGAGIPIRQRSDQQKIRIRNGKWNNPGKVPHSRQNGIAALARWAEEHPDERADMSRRHWINLANKARFKRIQTSRWVACFWCGRKVYRQQSRLAISPVSACCQRCVGFSTIHRRYHPDEPRPLILELLRHGADPKEIGAGDLELQELELEKILEKRNAA